MSFANPVRMPLYLPPEATDAGLMAALVGWFKSAEKGQLPAPVAAGLMHYQFGTIHPYCHDGNGRTAACWRHGDSQPGRIRAERVPFSGGASRQGFGGLLPLLRSIHTTTITKAGQRRIHLLAGTLCPHGGDRLFDG
ncbi:MAG: Fic family protein [Anaerolineae bacterium]|nr:Fic family protein [Anaerolineae bacterium]